MTVESMKSHESDCDGLFQSWPTREWSTPRTKGVHSLKLFGHPSNAPTGVLRVLVPVRVCYYKPTGYCSSLNSVAVCIKKYSF